MSASVGSQTGGAAKGGAAKGGSSKQTSAGVSLNVLEDDDSDAPMKLPTASRELRVALSQARTVRVLSAEISGIWHGCCNLERVHCFCMFCFSLLQQG